MELLLSFLLGAAASWAISHFYYTRTQKDAQDGLIAARLEECIDVDKAFLIAIQTSPDSVPRYGTFTVELVKKGATAQRVSSGTKTMVRSIEHRVGNCIVTQSHNMQDDHQATMTLTDRGKECVSCLLRHVFDSARFVEFDSAEQIAHAQFVAEHNREPKRALPAKKSIASDRART